MADDDIAISLVHSPEDVAAVAALFRVYAAALDVDLSYQGFEAELASLPGKYAPPDGALLIARRAEGTPVGCVALRSQEGNVAVEMKRLFVSPAARGTGLGRRLVQAVCDEARKLGYREVRLDSLPSMIAAITMYQAMGFVPTARYYDTAPAGTVFLARRLD